MREATVAASWPRSLIDFAVARGASRDGLLRRSCIVATDLEDPNARVPLTRYVALMDAAIEFCDDPALPLDFGEQVPMDQLSIVTLIASNAATPQDSGATINRYSALMLDDGEDTGKPAAEMLHRDGKLFIRFNSSVYRKFPTIAESGIARVVSSARRMVASLGDNAPMIRFPEAIHFEYAAPSHRDAYDRVLGVPVVFDSDMTGVVVDPSLLSLSMPNHYGAAAAMVTEKAEQLLTDLHKSGTTRQSVEKAIASNFASGDVRMETIARQLGLSRATLFRKLKAEGVSYDEVLENLRHDRALYLLNDEKRTVQQTAHMLGFSDPAAFSRAFKRWTGASPSARKPR